MFVGDGKVNTVRVRSLQYLVVAPARTLFGSIFISCARLQHRFYSVEVSLSLVAHLASSDPQGFATDPCSIHGGTSSFVFFAGLDDLHISLDTGTYPASLIIDVDVKVHTYVQE